MAILDWLKEIQLSPVLREKLVDSESKVSALELKISKLEEEVASLKSKLSQSEAQRGVQERQISKIQTDKLLGISLTVS